MLEKILGFSPTQNKQTQHNITAYKTVDLATVTFHPSHFLWYAELTIYIVMLVFSFIALLPFFLTAFYWIGVWLAFSLAVSFAIRKACHTKNALPKRLNVKQQQWRLTTHDEEFLITLNGEALRWSWLILIPVKEALTNKIHYLIALPDSLSKEEWRRLSVWLKLS